MDAATKDGVQNAELLEAALNYARLGWRVIPLHNVTGNGRCSCGRTDCQSAGKHPRVRDWPAQATADAERIMSWWGRWPGANLGVVTGAVSGLVVLDLDGPAGHAALKERGLRLPPSVMSQTGRGEGHNHVFFTHPGGHVPCSAGRIGPAIDVRGDDGYVLAPPSRTSGGYRWLVGPDAAALAPAPDWLLKATDKPPRAAPLPETIPQGERNKTLASLAGSMRRRRASEQAILAALKTENETRCRPPLGDDELRRIAASVARYAPADPPEPEPQNHALEVLTAADLLATTPQEPEWICEGVVARQALTDLVAGPKVGKTTFAVACIAAVLDGRPFLGRRTTPGRVLYLSEERAPTCRQVLERADVGGDGLRLVLRQSTWGWGWPDVVRAAAEAAREAEAPLLVVDSLADWAALAGDSENSSGAMLEALRPLQAAAAGGLAVLIVRHDRKGAPADLGEAGRGSNAAAGACDILFGLRKTLGVGHESRRRLDHLSRFDGFLPSQVIEWRPERKEYVYLGSEGAVEAAEARRRVLDVLPLQGPGLTEAELRQQAGDDTKRSTLQRVLRELLESGHAVREGRGKRGDPYRFRAGDPFVPN